MNQEIWKFELEITDKTEIELPKDYKILDVQFGKEEINPCVWILVYPENKKESVFFELFSTGQTIHNDIGIERKYIGTFKNFTGLFVGHLFQRIN